MDGTWRDLADVELRAKLRQQRVPDEVVGALVRRRDDDRAQEAIDRIFDGDGPLGERETSTT